MPPPVGAASGARIEQHDDPRVETAPMLPSLFDDEEDVPTLVRTYTLEEIVLAAPPAPFSFRASDDVAVHQRNTVRPPPPVRTTSPADERGGVEETSVAPPHAAGRPQVRG
jgi:hypothetical protein